MNISLMIYLLSVLDIIICVEVAFSVLLGVFIIISSLTYVLTIDDNYIEKATENFKKLFMEYKNRLIIVFAILLLFGIFTPNSKTISAMYLLPKIIANKDVQEIPSKAVKVLNSKLNEWIEDYTETKKP